MKEVFVTICSSAAVVHAQCNVAKHRVAALAFNIEPKPLHSVKQKHIKPCDNNLKSAKVYRALDEGILGCLQYESGDGEEDHPSRRWVVYFLIIFFVTFPLLYIASSMPGFSIKTNYSERGGRRVCVIFTLLSDVEGFCPPNTLLPMCCFERIRSEPIDLRNCKRRKSTLVD